MCSELRASGLGLQLEISETSPSCCVQLVFVVHRLQCGFGPVIAFPLSDLAPGGAVRCSVLEPPFHSKCRHADVNRDDRFRFVCQEDGVSPVGTRLMVL